MCPSQLTSENSWLPQPATLGSLTFGWHPPAPAASPSCFLWSRQAFLYRLPAQGESSSSHLALALGLNYFDTSCHLPALRSFPKGPQASPGKQVDSDALPRIHFPEAPHLLGASGACWP